jgi:methionyl-tRNA synthetase
MVEKYLDGKLPHKIDKKSIADNPIVQLMEDLESKIDKAMRDVDFYSALSEIWVLINAANKYVEDTKPWILAKENKSDKIKEFLFILIEVIKRVSSGVYPFMPDTATKIKKQIKKDKIEKSPPLFPRLE